MPDKPTKRGVSYERVRELFNYRNDGVLIRKTRNGSRRVGEECGYKTRTGYAYISVDDEKYLLHRIIFLWHQGYMPEGIVDHIDMNPLNNRIENLREVTKACNVRNCKVHNHNTSGIPGVFFVKAHRKYQATIEHNGKKIYLGLFDNKDDGALARWTAERGLDWSGCTSSSGAYLYLKENGLLPERFQHA